MNMALEFSTVSKSAHLTPEQIEEFGRRVEQIRQDVMQSLGEQDAKYIYKVRNFVRYTVHNVMTKFHVFYNFRNTQ